MTHSAAAPNSGPVARAVDAIEETLIAAILGAMTLVTFANVVTRYVLNSNILWALETTSFLFAWLVLMGASYCVKKTAHLGVDVITAAVAPPLRRLLGLLASAVCIVFAFLLLKGGWDFWAPYAELNSTSGRWFPTGFENSRGQGWFEVVDIPMPDVLNDFLAGIFNAGERYEKLPRLVPLAVLPLSMALLLLRFVQAAWGIWRGTRLGLVASHELEELLAEGPLVKDPPDDAGRDAGPPAGRGGR